MMLPPHDQSTEPDFEALLRLRRDLVAAGLTDNQLRGLVRAKVYAKPRQGAYVLCDEWNALTREQKHRVRARAILRTAHKSTVLTHTSAVIEHGGPVWGIPYDIVQTTRMDSPRAGRKADDWIQHRNKLSTQDVIEVNGIRVSKPARAALEVCTIVGVEAALVAVNGLLRRKLMTIDEFKAEVETHDDWPNSLRANIVVRLADDRTESVGEDRFLYLAFRQSLPRPLPQLEVFDEAGELVGRVDFAWPEKGVFLEFDGRIKYELYRRDGETLDEFLMREKKRQEKICLLTGWTCIRITWEDLSAPVLLAQRIRNIFASRRSPAA